VFRLTPPREMSYLLAQAFDATASLSKAARASSPARANPRRGAGAADIHDREQIVATAALLYAAPCPASSTAGLPAAIPSPGA